MQQKINVRAMMPGGRPTKYKPEYCDEVVDFMGKGFSFEAFAGHIGVCKDTLYQWVHAHEEFSDAKKRATEKSRLLWEQLTMNQFGKNEKELNFNTTAWVFIMKNRFGWRDKIEHTGSDDRPPIKLAYDITKPPKDDGCD